MVGRVTFVNYATYQGMARDALDTPFGARWGTVASFEGEPYWLEEAETRSKVLGAVARLLEAGNVDTLVIDRSRVRGLGSMEPTHPAYHASFSLWRKMSREEAGKVERSETVTADVHIAPNAYLFDEARL
jgi:hypothetical protein